MSEIRPRAPIRRGQGLGCGIPWDMAKDIGRIEARRRADGSTSSYRVVVHWEGQRWRLGHAKIGDRFRPLDSLEIAEFVLSDIRAEASRCGSVSLAVAAHLQRPDDCWLVRSCLRRWVERERNRCTAQQISPRTFEERARQVGRWTSYFAFFDDVHVFNVNFAVIEDWQSWLVHQGVPPVMRKRLQESLSAMFGWMEERGELQKPRMPQVRTQRKPPKIHTAADQRALLDAIPWQRRGIFLAMAHTLRPGEARAMDLLRWREPEMLVQRAFKGRKATSPILGTKESNWRIVEADEELCEWIRERVAGASPEERLRRADVPLFPNPDTGGGWFSHDAIRKQIVRASERAGVAYVPPYAATKHTTATDLFRRGFDRRRIRDFLGHVDDRTTDSYVVLAESETKGLMRARAPETPHDE